jgi:hypothetical protein
MSFYDENHQLKQCNEKGTIQLPKIIVQPGPSPYSNRKRSNEKPNRYQSKPNQQDHQDLSYEHQQLHAIENEIFQ